MQGLVAFVLSAKKSGGKPPHSKARLARGDEDGDEDEDEHEHEHEEEEESDR